MPALGEVSGLPLDLVQRRTHPVDGEPGYSAMLSSWGAATQLPHEEVGSPVAWLLHAWREAAAADRIARWAIRG